MPRPLLATLVVLSLPAAALAQDARARWIWSGAVTSSSAVVKAKVTPGTDGVELFLGDERVSAEPDSDGIVSFSISGLEPATKYEYRLTIEGKPSLSGHFSTFRDGPSSFRFVFGSCARTGSNHRVFETMESLDPRFMIHMGDFHYENIDENDPARFREAFDEVLGSPRQASFYRSTPIAYIWDDHDYGPNDSDRTSPAKPAALATYDQVVPHYPLDAVDGSIETLHQAFSVGRVRFIITDVRSERSPEDDPDGPSKTMLGQRQRDWLLREVEAAKAEHALIVWVNVVPWIVEPGDEHGWGPYDWERRFLADRFWELGVTNRMLVLSGDGHMVAIDDGSHSNYSTNGYSEEPGFPVVHAAPLDRYPRPKGGPYSHGVYAKRGVLFGLIQVQQFGLADVFDDGETLAVELSGRDERGGLLENMALRLECRESGCVTTESRY